MSWEHLAHTKNARDVQQEIDHRAMNTNEQRFTVTYHITVRDGRDIKDHAQDIAIEQTVEVPYDCLSEEHLSQRIIGEIEGIEAIDATTSLYKVVISYRCDVSGFAVPQLLNVLFGNISFKNNIKLVDLSLPESMQEAFPGPGKGIDGVREILGVYGRPLACTALKPMGLSSKKLAAMAEAYAHGGIDLIKDDHSIADQHFSPFRERVTLCQEAVERINAKNGRKTLYFPMVSGRFDEIEDQVRYAIGHGIKGILIAPMLVGLDTVRHLSQEYDLIIMTHPALTGVHFHDSSHGMTPAFLLGTLFRLIGADISIFPNTGGRFHFTKQECANLTEALRRPAGIWRRAFPCPAGGMQLDRIGEMAEFFGMDTVLLIGGSIIQQLAGLTQGTMLFMDGICSHFNEQLVEHSQGPGYSCEPEFPAIQAPPDGFLKFHNFQWYGRCPREYKIGGGRDSKNIIRHELVGNIGENTKFDLRYFEIAPAGYSSLEKHVHEHVIIGVRGKGILLKGKEEIPIEVHDIAYVAPLEIHQLRNQGDEPFGFFCIVDHERDRPIPV